MKIIADWILVYPHNIIYLKLINTISIFRLNTFVYMVLIEEKEGSDDPELARTEEPVGD